MGDGGDCKGLLRYNPTCVAAYILILIPSQLRTCLTSVRGQVLREVHARDWACGAALPRVLLANGAAGGATDGCSREREMSFRPAARRCRGTRSCPFSDPEAGVCKDHGAAAPVGRTTGVDTGLQQFFSVRHAPCQPLINRESYDVKIGRWRLCSHEASSFPGAAVLGWACVGAWMRRCEGMQVLLECFRVDKGRARRSCADCVFSAGCRVVRGCDRVQH